MSVGFVLFLVALGVLVVGWLALGVRQPLVARRRSQEYQHQHTENPDYLPGHAGQGGI